LFEAFGEIAGSQPLGGQGKAALGMIRWPEPAESPELFRQCESVEILFLAPPHIPGAAQVTIHRGSRTGKFGGEQPTDAEQPRMEMERIVRDFGIDQLREEFGQAAHGPNVIFITQGGEQAFLEGLIPAHFPGAGGEFLAFALESDLGGLGEHFAEAGIRPVTERRLAAAPKRIRKQGIDTEPMAQFIDGRVELAFQDQGGERLWFGRAGFPDDVELNPAVGGIDVVFVAMPCGGVQVDLDIAGSGEIIAELDEGIAEVRAGLVIPETGVKNSDGLAVQGEELIAADALVLPEGLEKAFGGLAVGGFLEPMDTQGTGAPLGITF
jgi:hypothetical protein